MYEISDVAMLTWTVMWRLWMAKFCLHVTFHRHKIFTFVKYLDMHFHHWFPMYSVHFVCGGTSYHSHFTISFWKGYWMGGMSLKKQVAAKNGFKASHFLRFFFFSPRLYFILNYWTIMTLFVYNSYVQQGLEFNNENIVGNVELLCTLHNTVRWSLVSRVEIGVRVAGIALKFWRH